MAKLTWCVGDSGGGGRFRGTLKVQELVYDKDQMKKEVKVKNLPPKNSILMLILWFYLSIEIATVIKMVPHNPTLRKGRMRCWKIKLGYQFFFGELNFVTEIFPLEN